jgi:hypothetical protein
MVQTVYLLAPCPVDAILVFGSIPSRPLAYGVGMSEDDGLSADALLLGRHS